MGFSDFLAKLTSTKKATPFDPGVFGTDLALKTSWLPLARGGSNFKSRTLKQISPSELHFTASTTGKIFIGFFMLFPILFIGAALFMYLDQGFDLMKLPFLIIPLFILGVGLFVFSKMNQVVVFNKQTGYFYKGKKKKRDLSPTHEENKNNFRLETIKALQIIPEYIKGSKTSYHSYEINVIFEDGSRYNVIDHGHKSSIEKDAIILSNFLGVPLWNKMEGTSHTPQTSNSTSGSYNSIREKDILSPNSQKVNKPSTTSDLDEEYDSLKPRKM